MSNPRASVIVLNWNGLKYLKSCLDAVLAQDYDNFEVIVVDNGSTDGSAEFVAESYPQVNVIHNERNLGFAGGNNIGLRAAAGDLLVLLNNDTEVHPGWLRALSSSAADPGTGIVGAKALYPDGRIQHAGGYVGQRGAGSHYGHREHDNGQFDQAREVDYVTGATLAITRKAFETIGELDEGYTPIYYEDVDWCYQARAAGLRVVFQPQAEVIHYESATTEGFSYEQRLALNQGRLRFVFKHWSADRLLGEFGPEESAWVAAMDRSEELMTARHAYLNTILTLRDILAFRKSSQKEADALAGLLSDLRASALTSLTSVATAEIISESFAGPTRSEMNKQRTDLLETLRENQVIREVPFTSQVPVLRSLIVAARNLWNNVAARWYVQPMIDQQSIFNAQVVSYLHDVEQRLQGQSLDVTENIRELTALAEHVDRLTGTARSRERGGDREH